MGCGGSRLEGGELGEAVPAGIRPLLLRRFEEFRGRRNASTFKDASLSKKELLDQYAPLDDDDHPPADDDDSFQITHGRKSVARENLTSLKQPLIDSEDEFILLPESKDQAAADHHQKEVKNVNGVDKNEEKDEDEDEDEGEDEDVDERDICPGSPSFRVYYVDPQADQKKDDNSKDDDKNIKSRPIDESGETETSNEHLETKISKKGSKGKRFRTAMQKGGKNLLNVKSCYNPANASHDEPHLLAQKEA